MPSSPQQPQKLSNAEEQAIASAVKLLAETVKRLVQLPEQVFVEASTSGKTATLLLNVSPQDIGSILGNSGRTVRSLKTVVIALSNRSFLDIHFELVVKS